MISYPEDFEKNPLKSHATYNHDKTQEKNQFETSRQMAHKTFEILENFIKEDLEKGDKFGTLLVDQLHLCAEDHNGESESGE